MLEYLKPQENSYLNKIAKMENKIEKINTKLEKYETLSKGIQGIEAEPPANKSQHIEKLIVENVNYNNALTEFIVNLKESAIADRVILSNAVIMNDLNIDISRGQAEKNANMSEKQSADKQSVKQPVKNSEKTQQTNKSDEKQSVQSVNNSDKITKDTFKINEAEITDKYFFKVELEMNDALWNRFAKKGLVLDDTSIKKVFVQGNRSGRYGQSFFYIPSSDPYKMPKSIPVDKILTLEELYVTAKVTSEIFNNQTNKKSLLGELHNNQQKLSKSGKTADKTADLNKNMTKTPEVSLA